GASTLWAQTKVITGTVTSAVEGEGAIPGVSVFVKGTTIATSTDVNGKYSLTVPEDATTLVFSFIGMKQQEVNIAGRSVVNCVMESDVVGLSEVVVTALGIKREKREITYQTQKVDNAELAAAQPTRAGSALAGKVAGLQINVQDNSVNPTTQIILRGLRSISSDNQALVVIDGVIASLGAFDDLNPNDIADLSILKGATAAALYGSNAANGAIVVTTKKGQAGEKITVGINASYTAEQVAYMPRFQSKYGTGWEGAYDAVENTNWGPRFDGTLRQIGPTWPDGTYQAVPYAPVKDNLLAFFNTGNNFNNTIYLSGSHEASKFYVSVGDQRATGIVPDDSYQRNTVRVNASKKVGKVELSLNSSYFKDETDVVGGTIGDQDRPLYWFLLNTSANIPLSRYSDWRNDLYATPDGYYNAYYQNPYWAVGTNRNNYKSNRLNGNVQASWDPLSWLNITARIGTNTYWTSGKNWRAAQTYDPVLQPSAGAVSSFVEDSESQSSEVIEDLLMTGSFEFGKFSLKAILGGSNYNYIYRYSKIRADNLSIPDFYDISNGTGTPTVEADASQEVNFGFFGDFTLGYGDFLYFNFSGRNDWTSTLAKGNNNYFYPGFGVSFVLTDAIDALKNNDILSYAKLTASNSTVYNDLSPYRINETFSKHESFPFGAVNGFLLSGTSVDANIKKEKLNTTEFGANLGLFRSRIMIDFSYFMTTTSDLITFTTPSRASGSTSFLTNIGSLKGNGYEVSLSGSIIRGKNLTWDMSLNYSSETTVVKEIYEGLDEVAVSSWGSYGIYAIVDMPYPQLKANTYVRDPQGRIVVDPATGFPLQNAALESMGRTTPKHIFGLNTSLKAFGFALSTTIDYRTGHVFYSQGQDTMEFTGRSMESVSANRQDFVIPNSVIETSPGVYVENTNIPVQNGRQSYWTDTYNDVKENYVIDATAFKIRELALTYTLPSTLMKNTPLQKVSVGLIARNLYTLLPAENAFSDPEFNNSNSNAIGVGGYFQMPPTRSFGVNLNIEF
ncbi:MAG: SusC/RagA family TonB-linked outer membrane protein, partial [Bacteroidota bacterium]|nr:SusC/RagA family TonB-linked outer membrane protein [Bacteroidota bacterium]